MAGPFSQTVIAVVWDFDKTLIPGNMQTPLFARYGVDERAFWDEVDALRDFYLAHGARRVADDSLYLNHILEYVRAGVFEGLSNATLHELGAELSFRAARSGATPYTRPKPQATPRASDSSRHTPAPRPPPAPPCRAGSSYPRR